jgi:capsular exopolysaccharide synthesis family protein
MNARRRKFLAPKAVASDVSMLNGHPAASATQAGPPPPDRPTPLVSGESGLKAIGTLIRRRWRVILIPTILVPLAAIAFSLSQSNEYTASASLLFQDTSGSRLASDDPTREAATNVKLIQIGVLDNRVARDRLGTAVASAKIDVVNESDSNVVTVQARSATSNGAALAANAYARAYVELRRDLGLSDLKAQERRTQAQIDALPKTSSGRQDKRSLSRKQRRLRLAEGDVSPDVRVVRPATAPSAPSSPKPARNGFIGLFAGLLLGLGLAVGRERLDLRVRDPRFFEAAVGSPILARIPRSRALRKTLPGFKLPPVEGQAFRDLRANLYWAMNGHVRSVVIASAEPGEGKTTVVWNLACAIAHPNVRVVIVEADLRRPALSARLGGSRGPGLTEVLTGQAQLGDAIRELAVQSGPRNDQGASVTVGVLFAGGPPDDPTGLLESERMREVLDSLVAHYDIVLVDTAPTSVASDVVPLVSRVGGVVVVGRLAKSRTAAVTEFGEQMRRLGAPTLGVVVNSSEFPRETYRYYYSHR